MNLTADPTDIKSADPQLIELEKRYRRSTKKLWFVLAIPVLCGLGAIVADLIGELWAWEALVGWCLLVTFLVGVFILYQVPATSDVVHQYSQYVLPKIFLNAGLGNVRVARRHDLAIKTFLESGLYYDKYNAISREDAILGQVVGSAFGMYEVAMQVGGTRMNQRTGIAAGVRTNHFYGWFIVVEQKRSPGFHFITLRRRVNSGESDDWHAKTLSHWEKDVTFLSVETGNAAFDQLFCVKSDQPGILRELLTPSVIDLLLHLGATAKNSFAISMQRGHLYMLIGHASPSFRHCPEKNFTQEVPAELLEEVSWFVEALRGIARINR